MNVSVVPDSATPVDPPNSTTVKPAWSLSVVMAATVWSLSASKSSSESASTTEIVMVVPWSPSMMSSSTPVTVTICAVSQFADVKVSVEVTVASPVSDEVMERTTSLSGWALRTTVIVSVVPDSSTPVDPSVSATVNPATSSSVVDTETV